jgi:hypothetical protein
MLYAMIGFYRDGAKARLLEISDQVNEYLGQPLVPQRLAAVLRGKDRERVGNLVLIDAPNFEEAERRFHYSPVWNAGLYERAEVTEIDIEIGEVKSD